MEALSTSERIGGRAQAQSSERPAVSLRRSKFLAGDGKCCPAALQTCQSSGDATRRQGRREARCEAGSSGRDVRAQAAVKDLNMVQEDVEKTEMVSGDTYGVAAELSLPRVSSGKSFVAPLYPGFKSR